MISSGSYRYMLFELTLEPSMAGLKDKRGFIDKDRIDLTERQSVEYWMKKWGVTRDQIVTAHRKVGRMT